ncbi:MAG TPA: class I SAM-dependent methyltransferase [Anaerolineae bacterium]|nr:class I SAM-dependent methyltransferase [Anaerolineae bacterium]
MAEQSEQWKDGERAGQYARQRSLISKWVYARLAKQVLACLEPSLEAPTIVDLGCGPGFLGIDLGRLRPQARIVGVDPSGEMLAIARVNAAAAGILSYEATQGRAEELPLASGSASLVISQSSFHEWEDPRRGLEEICRVLVPGGSLIVTDYNIAWLSNWKRKVLGRLHPLHMFRFGFEDVAAMARSVGLEQIEGRGRGMQYFLFASKPKRSVE